MEGSIKNFTKNLHHKRLYLGPPRTGVIGAFDEAWLVLKQERGMRTPDEESMILEMFRHVMGYDGGEAMHLRGGNSNHLLNDMYEGINNDEEAHGRFSSFIEGNPMHRSGAEVNWDAVLDTSMKPHQDPPEYDE